MNTYRPSIAGIAMLVLLAVAAGCSPAAPGFEPQKLPTETQVVPANTQVPPTGTPTTLPTGTLIPPKWSVGTAAEAEAIEVARRALAEQLKVGENTIELEYALPVNWSDTSLGCPQEGMMYAQVIVPGYRIGLQAGGTSYQVHVGDGRAVVCAEPADPAPAPDEVAALARVIELARQDLAERLGIDLEQIEVRSAEAVTWPNTSLGCPKPGMMYAEVLVEGYLIELVVDGKSYEYHADQERVVLCQVP